MNRTVIIIVVLVVVIAAAVVIALKTTSAAKPLPPGLVEKKMQVYDIDAKKIIEVNQVAYEQKFAIDRQTRYKIDPATGHKLALPLACAACQKMIAPAVVPAGQDQDTFLRSYRCPECGQSPFPPDYFNR